VEYRITSRENVARMMKMGIKNLPCILVNGELKFSSLIPGQPERAGGYRPLFGG
jgi:uroporphyrinogen decarboxylase